MFTIGDFARLGRVSVRMLRHYDAIGLLRPAAVDPASGYRFYRADQLGQLNRVVALKDLGFTLQQVQTILDGQVSVEELRGMLRLRRAQLEAQLATDANRLAGVEARLRMIESEGHMNTEDVVVKRVPPVRVAELTAVAASYQSKHIGPVIEPLYAELIGRLEAAGVQPTGPAIAYYEPATAPTGEPGDEVVVHAAMPVAVDSDPGYGFAVVDLPGIRSAATIIHCGDVAEVESSLQALARWIDDNGYRTDGYAREVYLEYCRDERDKCVTELQLAVVKE
jgi:DNA-binding transcriptional MerR regulator/effector-binding domain-containing protein